MSEEQNVVELIVDDLLLNKSVLFVSDVFTYNSIVFELKECFEDVNLYLFAFSKFSTAIVNEIDFDIYDRVVFYLSSSDKKEVLKEVIKYKENIIVF